VIWHDVRNPNDPELDVLAERYHLHPLHVEDCRHRNQRAKVETGNGYVFVVSKPAHINAEGETDITDLDFFLGADFLITVQEGICPDLRNTMDQLHAGADQSRADQLFYKVLDATVDAYAPVLERFHEAIDEIEDKVLEKPEPATVQRIFGLKRGLIELRRVLTNMRDVANQLERLETDLIQRDLWPFLRDVHDHLARDVEEVEMHRDLLSGAMDIYLSSVANRTNQVMKVLTVMGTVALPSIVISGFFGMNTKGLLWADSPHATEIAVGLMMITTIGLLVLLKKFDWF
jgi:magnesium transporter